MVIGKPAPFVSAFVDAVDAAIRMHQPHHGRRVNTLCQGAASLRDQLVLFQVYPNFVLPHASLRQPWPAPEVTNGRGSATRWRPCTPAMAAGAVYLHPADKSHRRTRRPLQGQKGLDERALIASHWSSKPW